MVISMTNASATQWLAFACLESSPRLADGPTGARREKSAFFLRVRYAVPAFAGAGAQHVPTQQIADKGGLRGPQPWRDEPVIS
ncbi:hypothetical protein [Thermoactinospora rubra]|uniref:hypothetical protein n=1 Tax=Thermoactinospora rubra TaxID=1088767 RepID=UPI000A0F80E1|nr:hypothetical protein [Thermoactinospora rubra]